MERPSKNTLIRYFRGQCMPHEIEPVKLYLAIDTDKAFVESCLKAAWLTDLEDSRLEISDAEASGFKERFYARQQLLSQLPPLEDPFPHKPLFRLPVWIKVAAAVLVLAGMSLFVHYKTDKTATGKLAQRQDKEVLPGKERALLTLADGSVISLADAPSGKLALGNGLQVDKTEGEIVYSGGKEAAVVSAAMNTIATPKGGQYRVTLPDGTRAWLNAASSLSYPLEFSKNGRRVKMAGEVYFEVAKVTQPNSAKRIPFFVESHKQVVEVLGTHFNINAYPDENAIKTTLAEGSVRVKSLNGHSVLLQPGQQAVLAENLRVESADIRQQLAWKNGDFIFRGETLESALRQVARWYDVEVDCPAHLGKLRFNGMVSRSQPLSMIIAMIELTKQAKVTLKERRLIVTD